jgi:cell division septal protein FtsQ
MSRKGAARNALRSVAAGIAAPADKRFRRSDYRPGRRRTSQLIARFWKPAVVVIGAGAVVAAAAGVILTAPALAVDRLVLRGQQRLSSAEVEALLGGLIGSNILRADLEAYRQKVLASTWVETASLRRVLPSTIEVRVVERVPVAIARLHQQLYLVDAAGVVIDEFGPTYRDLDLPMVDGLAGPVAARGAARIDRGRIQLVDRFLQSFGARADLRERISQIDVTNAADLVVLLDDDAAYLHLGTDQFVERLEFYLQMLPKLGEQFQQIDYVDLRVEGRLFVGARDQPAATVALASRGR